jgi:hypothetical protein
MRIAAKSELQRVLSETVGAGAALVLAVPFSIAVLNDGLTGLKEVASHIHS